MNTGTQNIIAEQRKNWQLLILGWTIRWGRHAWISTSSFFFSWSHQHLSRNHSLKMSKTWFLTSSLFHLQTPTFPLPLSHTDSWDQTPAAAWITKTSILACNRVADRECQITQDLLSAQPINQLNCSNSWRYSVQSPLPPSTHGPSSGSWGTAVSVSGWSPWYLVLHPVYLPRCPPPTLLMVLPYLKPSVDLWLESLSIDCWALSSVLKFTKELPTLESWPVSCTFLVAD